MKKMFTTLLVLTSLFSVTAHAKECVKDFNEEYQTNQKLGFQAWQKAYAGSKTIENFNSRLDNFDIAMNYFHKNSLLTGSKHFGGFKDFSKCIDKSKVEELAEHALNQYKVNACEKAKLVLLMSSDLNLPFKKYSEARSLQDRFCYTFNLDEVFPTFN